MHYSKNFSYSPFFTAFRPQESLIIFFFSIIEVSSQYVTVSGCFDLDIDKLKKFTIKIFNSLLRPNNIGQEAI